MKPLGVLLAGGLSRRMGGGDKGLLLLNGTPVMRYAFDRLAQQTESLVINANGKPERFTEFQVPVIADTKTGFAGPLAGILAGLRYAATHAPYSPFIVTAAADTPFFPDNLVTQFLHHAQAPDIIVLASFKKRIHPVFGLWPTALADDLEKWLEDPGHRKVLDFVERHEWAQVDFISTALAEATFDPFFNINTPDDLHDADTLLKSREIL